MKKTSILVLTLLAVLAFAGARNVNAAETTLKPFAPYAEDFESFEVGAGQDALFQQTGGLIWYEPARVSGEVADVEGDKQLKYTIASNDEWALFGGIGGGASDNLRKLIPGLMYHFSMYVDTTSVQAGSELYVEYQSSDWVGVKIVDGQAMLCDPDCAVYNLEYANKVLEFDFIGYDFGSEMDRGYVKLTAHNMAQNDVFYFDDLAITEVISVEPTVSMDFEGKEAGSNAHDTPMIYGERFDAMTFEQEEGNGYLRLTEVYNDLDVDHFAKFYFNRLPVTSDVEYRLDVDIEFVSDYNCFYFGYDACQYEYHKDGTYNAAQAGTRLGETSWDGKHLSVVFTPSDSLGQWWPQVWLTLFLAEGVDLDVKFDNLVITETVSQLSAKSLSANLTNERLCLGEELNAKDFEVTLTRNNDLSRVLASDEYVVDLSQVNKDAAGEYPVVIKAVDELGGEVSTTVTVEYVEGHIWDEGVETTPATPDAEGVKTFTCECGATKEEAIAKLPKMVTIYFQNNWNWTDINVHYWGEGVGTEWPGKPMELAGTCTGWGGTKLDFYSIEIDANKYTGFIFNGMDNGNRNQSPNLNVADYLENFATDLFYMDWKEGTGNLVGHFPMAGDAGLHFHEYNGYGSDATNHWHACSCGLKAADAVNEEHSFEVVYANGYRVEYCTVCEYEKSKEAMITYVITNCNDAEKNVPGYIEATDGAYLETITLAAWDVLTMYYDGSAISSGSVTMLPGTGWKGGAWAGVLYPLYHDGSTTGFISAKGGEYKVAYNPTENTLLFGDVVENAYTVLKVGADAEIAIWNVEGFEIKDINGAYKTPNGWRLYIVVDAKGRIAYMAHNMVNGYGGAISNTYMRHTIYSSYRANPAFTNLSDEYEGQWGTTVDWALGVPQGGFIITAHGGTKAALIEAITGLVGEAQTDAAVNTNAFNVDAFKITYNAAQDYIQVTTHEHASTEWEKDATHHWHLCSECELEMDKAEHSWGEGEVTEAPSHTEAGVRTFTCSCGETKTAEEPAVGHSHSTEWSKDATHHWHECSCGDKADKAEHTYGEGVVTKEPTTEAKGEKTFTCSCGHSYTEEIAKLEPAPQPEPEQKGCGGSVIASIFGVLALAGSVVVLRKKREE